MLQFETKSTAAVSALAFSPDGMRLLVGYTNGPVQEWDALGSSVLQTMYDDFPVQYAIAWSPNGASWTFTTNRSIVELTGKKQLVHTVFAKHDPSPSMLMAFGYLTEKLAASGQGHPTMMEAGAIRLHHLHDGKWQPKSVPIYESSGVRALDVHRDSRLLAWITGHAQLKLWRTDRPDNHSIPLKKTATRVKFSPDGSIVAIAVEWGVLTYSTDKRFPLNEFKGHKGKVTSLDFSPDGRRIVTGSWDETVREWDVTTGKEVRSMQWKIGKISALSYAPDGTRVAAGSTSGKVITWDVD